MTAPAHQLVLDFDGVVCDALTECAAVTLAGARPGSEVPALAETVGALTPSYLALFRSVRPHSRTLTDFMVTNTVTGPLATRAEFDAARSQAGPDLLREQTIRAQTARDEWRVQHPDEWIRLHATYPGIEQLVRAASGRVSIVSNKDAASIALLLTHFGLAEHVGDIVGDCSDKPAAVARLLAPGGSATFVDDNVANAIDVGAVPGVKSLWATWGYHSCEDVATAASHGLRQLALTQLSDVA